MPRSESLLDEGLSEARFANAPDRPEPGIEKGQHVNLRRRALAPGVNPDAGRVIRTGPPGQPMPAGRVPPVATPKRGRWAAGIAGRFGFSARSGPIGRAAPHIGMLSLIR